MDEQHFDALTRPLGTAPRRSLLWLGLSGLAALVASRAWPVQAQQNDSQTCAAGLTLCPDAGCVDLQSDLDHCGACGILCASQLVAVDCRNGECVRADCPSELEYCGPVDLCRDLQSDPANCGGCSNACASGVCERGVCAPVLAGLVPKGKPIATARASIPAAIPTTAAPAVSSVLRERPASKASVAALKGTAHP